MSRGQAVHLARSLIRAEEKQRVLLDRAPQGKSKLVLLERWSRLMSSIPEKFVGVENIIAEELKYFTVVIPSS